MSDRWNAAAVNPPITAEEAIRIVRDHPTPSTRVICPSGCYIAPGRVVVFHNCPFKEWHP